MTLANRWNCILSGPMTGAENMAADMALASAVQCGASPSTLRLYGWKPWAVSLGYNQRETDIDHEACTRYGFDIVRRPTGGRAILHANELTYAVAMPANGTGITETYSRISKALVEGLSGICPSVSYESSQLNFQSLYKRQESIPCFSASARYEVQIGGKKLVGSAQRRFTVPDLPEVVLQHGSILLGTEHQLLAEILSVNEEAVKQKILSDIEGKTIDLSTAVGRTVTMEEAAAAVIRGFERTMGITFVPTIEATV
ncbi:MAG: lipoate--protein ligase family protein [Bacteroidetes bacterium]|nr:lipoate--protein ligase family protein [Bacteroidota bacterium]